MITNMREIYPDETIYSWFARYHKISGNLSISDTIFELLDYNSKVYSFDDVFGLNRLCDKLPESFNYSSDYLILNHTLFPFYKPFMDSEKSEKLMESMKNKFIKNNCINRVNHGIEHEIKFCPKCYEEDKKKYGEAYIHRVHQVYGNFLCYKHRVNLIRLKHERYSFIDIDNVETELKEEKSFLEDRFIDISNSLIRVIDSEYLYNGTYSEIKKKYKYKLIENGYWNRDGVIHQQRLISDFKNFYSEEILNILNVNLDYGTNWIKRIFLNENKKLIHPLKHVLLINFIFGGITEFENYQCLDFRPYGVAPWPCLNPCCSEYKKNVIYNCDISRDKKNNFYKGNFQCPICEFTYLRCGVDKSDEDRYRIGRVLSYGQLWDNKLTTLVSYKNYSLRELSIIMGCSRDTIKIQSKRLRLDIGNVSEKSCIKKGKKSKDLFKAKEYKERMLEFIQGNESISRNEIRYKLSKEYTYLYRNEKQWLKRNLPKSISRGEAMKEYSERYWGIKDVEISIKVKKAIEEILTEIPLRRITKKYISKKINYYGFTNPAYLKKMPITKNLLDSKCETIEEFKLRSI